MRCASWFVMGPQDPFYGLNVDVPSHVPDPFWGTPASWVDWCEPNYAQTRYVAEFFNTLSSVPMLVVGIRGLWLCHRYQLETRFYLCWAGIGAVGIGSLLFHGTLSKFGQATDELAMIYASLAFAYVVLEVGHKECRRPWLPVVEVCYAVSFTVAYFASAFFFPFFCLAYALTVVLIIHQSYRVYTCYRTQVGVAARWQRWLFAIAASFYPFGFLLFWVPENALCPLFPHTFRLLNLHAIFHLLTTTSPYCYVVFMTYHRCTVLKRQAEHRGGGGLVYVHVFEESI